MACPLESRTRLSLTIALHPVVPECGAETHCCRQLGSHVIFVDLATAELPAEDHRIGIHSMEPGLHSIPQVQSAMGAVHHVNVTHEFMPSVGSAEASWTRVNLLGRLCFFHAASSSTSYRYGTSTSSKSRQQKRQPLRRCAAALARHACCTCDINCQAVSGCDYITSKHWSSGRSAQRL